MPSNYFLYLIYLNISYFLYKNIVKSFSVDIKLLYLRCVNFLNHSL